jgi:fluoroquinolone transport system ATP-binding protein
MISVKNLRFTYPKAGQEAVKNLNFTIEQGEIFGFLGPSGAGKSTTQKILIGLLADCQGDITVENRDLKTWKADYYEKIGVCFEAPNHYLKMTGLENLNYFKSLYRGETEKPQELLHWVGLSEDANLPVAGYSKGMKMRLNFARSLLHRPEIMFLDEPTTGLDPVNARIVKNIIREKKAQGKTIFLTTHDMAVADQLCDRVAFIVDGEIKLIDSPQALKIRYGRRDVAVEFGFNGQIERVEFPLDNLGQNENFFNLLQNHPVQTIHTQETTLETVFIEVTGRNLL